MYFVYDPEDGISFFETEKEAKDEAHATFEHYIDDASSDGWHENTEDLCWGKVYESVHQTGRKKAPEDSEFDEIWSFDFKDERFK